MLRSYIDSPAIHHYLQALKSETPTFGMDRQILIRDGEQPQLIYRPNSISNNQKILPLYEQELQEVDEHKQLQIIIADHITAHHTKLQDTKTYNEKSFLQNIWEHSSESPKTINEHLARAVSTYEFAHRTTKNTKHLLNNLKYHTELIQGFSEIHTASNALEMRAWDHVYGVEQLALERGVLDAKIANYLGAFTVGNNQ